MLGVVAHGYPLADMDQPGIDLSGTWAATIADEPSRRAFFEPSYDDRRLGLRRAAPDTGARTLRSRRATGRSSIGAGSTHPTGRAKGRAAGSCSTASSTSATCGSTAPISARPRATSSHTSWTSPTHLAAGHEHLLAIEVACARQSDRTAKRNITGVFQHWDCIDPDWNPGGIWRPVRIERTGPVRITRLRALCREADATRAILSFVADLDSDEARTVTLRTSVPGACRVERRAPARRGRQPSRVAASCRQPRPLVAACARGAAAARRRRRGVGRRRGEPRAASADGVPVA